MGSEREAAADYVIVGGGSAGSVLAARLSQDPGTAVTLIEAGPEQKDVRLAVPAMIGEVLGNRIADWDYATVPQARLDDRSLRWPRGKVMGGSSAINAMCYSRGDLRDYDRWAELGAKGWSGAEALHFFKASETHSEGESQWHGQDGPLHVTRPRDVRGATKRFLRAAEQMGLRRIEDFAGPDREGVGLFDTTTRRGRRCSAAKAYLTKAVRARPNLTIVTEASCRRVLFDGARASGVEYERGGEIRMSAAKREVILCAGAIGTPQLLMLSGVGPSAHLRRHGIGLVADRPGVGANLRDHLDLLTFLETEPGETISYSVRGLLGNLTAGLEYLIGGTGILASNLAEGTGFVSSRSDRERPDIQFHFVPALAMDHGEEKSWGRFGVSLHACNLYPESTGTIRLASADPDTPPLIDPNYLATERDWEVMVEGAKLSRRLLSQPAFEEVAKGFLRPETEPGTDEEWRQLIAAEAETIYHPVGTARMGPAADEGAVTDPSGLVHGTQGLRVVDASLFPDLPGGNTNAPTIMVAERIFARSMAQ
ncbi:GMC family oxidoreductase [Parvularcula oceani]|uniref:GMC family oxidoreductase n=1 Tax=Parvularcula oceani TaxID=1247963 RepID=UPI0004E12B5B|nr:GMC family oxidoreductase N-terminal domain-containing protein [Parvularcula oceani]